MSFSTIPLKRRGIIIRNTRSLVLSEINGSPSGLLNFEAYDICAMANSSALRVHLDHLLQRQSIRYLSDASEQQSSTSRFQEAPGQSDPALRYNDIRGEWFNHIRKPDFQRETNSWTPQDCVQFLDSVVNGRIIPSIILWRNQDNNLIFVLDGSHRLSVIRAWMFNDWGDNAGDYYKRKDNGRILEAANYTRRTVDNLIGGFKSFEHAYNEFRKIIDRGGAPKLEMESKRYNQASFYNDVVAGHHTLSVQWAKGDYDSAEQSFLRINRSGQALDPWEASLIEYRKGSYARCVMSIANGGENGHYWPDPAKGEIERPELIKKIDGFRIKSLQIHERLFVPPFTTPIKDLNVPFMVAPAYFQKHKYLLELLPLIFRKEIAITEEHQLGILGSDNTSAPEVVIANADQILTSLENSLDHLISLTHSSKSLSIVPLFYWYNQRGQYSRGIFYGFIDWLLSGTNEDIQSRKLIFAGNRDRFEYLHFELKREILTLQERGGAGLKAVGRVAAFFQNMLDLLHEKSDAQPSEVEGDVLNILHELRRPRNRKTPLRKKARTFSRPDKSQINIKELFDNAIRCHICGGVVNLHSGVQYDHVEDYALTQTTDPETGKPTHPFCNRHKQRLLDYRQNRVELELPSLTTGSAREVRKAAQLTFWGVQDYPQ